MNNPTIETTSEQLKTFQPTFKGTGSEYFKIWIVNLVLTIITFGIYSAWATVRTRRYFAGNTYLDEHNFDFHGSPISILIGRIITVFVLALYFLLQQFMPLVATILSAAVILFVPILIVKGLRFRLTNTSYRNLRFNFVANIKNAYLAFLPICLLFLLILASSIFIGVNIPTTDPELFSEASKNLSASVIMAFFVVMLLLFVARPLFVFFYNRFLYSYIKYGDHKFNTALELKSVIMLYAKYYLISLLAIIPIALIFAGLSFLFKLTLSDSGSGALLVIAFISLAITLLAVGIKAYITTRLNNLIYQSLTVSKAYFTSNWELKSFWMLLVSNTLLVIFTLGFGYPWAKVRVAKYKADHIALQATNLEEFTGSNEVSRSALGDELAEGFDIEFGL